MNICYIYDAAYPWEPGGVQKRVWELSTRLARNHDVHWYSLQYWDGPKHIERDGVMLHGVQEATDLYVGDRRSISEALRFASRLVTALPRNEFDVIDCQEFPYFPIFSSKLRSMMGRPTLLVTWHEVWDQYWYEYLGWKGICGQAVERLAARVADTHVAVSKRTYQEVQQLGARNPHYVPNGIDLAYVDSVPPANREIDFLYVGRLIPEKGVDLLIRALDQLIEHHRIDPTCLIVGDGPAKHDIHKLIDERGLAEHVEVHPFREQYQDVLALMKASRVFALPSRREGFGITALEALACKTPVATIDHPHNAASDLITDGKDGTISRPTPTAFAQALNRAMFIPTDHCRDVACAYEWDRIARGMEQLYRTVA